MIQLQSGEPKGSLLAYLLQDVYDIAIFENVPIHIEAYIANVTGEPRCDSEIKSLLWIDRNYKFPLKRLYDARAPWCPLSAAALYQRSASSRSAGTPQPFS